MQSKVLTNTSRTSPIQNVFRLLVRSRTTTPESDPRSLSGCFNNNIHVQCECKSCVATAPRTHTSMFRYNFANPLDRNCSNNMRMSAIRMGLKLFLRRRNRSWAVVAMGSPKQLHRHTRRLVSRSKPINRRLSRIEFMRFQCSLCISEWTCDNITFGLGSRDCTINSTLYIISFFLYYENIFYNYIYSHLSSAYFIQLLK